MLAADRQVLAGLIAETEESLARALGPGVQAAGVALVDYPSHQNVGDAMIWQGELAHLKRLGVPVRYVADVWRFDAATLRRLPADAPILLHGGGNFGDLWPEFQDFRMRVVAAFPGRKIVQLPQSVWFSDPGNARRADAHFARHPDFTLLVRDVASLDRVGEQLPNVRVEVCPDAAFGLGALDVPRMRREPVMLLRRDREVATGRDAALGRLGVAGVDWGLSGWEQALWTAVRIPGRLHSERPLLRRPLYPVMRASYDAMTRLNLRAGVQTFADACCVLTDRLHAHVLAALMGIPHVVFDNSYGKIGALYRDWTQAFSTITFAETPGDAADAFRELQGRCNGDGPVR